MLSKELKRNGYKVVIINELGQVLTFSGTLFLNGICEVSDGMKFFDTYCDALSFATSFQLPAEARTYCIYDDSGTCIKSGTGEEEKIKIIKTGK